MNGPDSSAGPFQLSLSKILAKFTGTPSAGKFLDYTGAWNTPPLTNQIFSLGANQDLVYNIPSGSYAHWFRINDVDKFTIGYSPVFGYGADNWRLGGIKSAGTSQIYYDCTSAHYWRISGGNVAAIGGSGFIEGGRLCLGQTITTPIDPGAGGLALTGLIRYFSSYGSTIADGTLVQTYTDGSDLFHNVNSGSYHGLKIGGFNTYTFGYSPTLAAFGTNVFQLGDGSGAYIHSDGFALVANVSNTYTFQFKYAGATSLSINDKCTSTGSVICGNGGANATTATGPFFYASSCAGAPTGTPTAVTGHIPFTFDATNNKLYAYLNSAWKSVTLT